MLKDLFKKRPKSIFLGRKVRKYWDVSCLYDLREITETLERVKVLEKIMDIEFNVNDEIYLEEFKKYATIEKKTKDTNGDIIYNITYVAECMCDEESKQIAEVKLQDILYKEEQIRKQSEEDEQKREDEYKEFRKEKDKIQKKGIIIQKIPTDNKGNKIYNSKQIKELHRSADERFIDYDVITTLVDIEIKHYDENGKSEIKIL